MSALPVSVIPLTSSDEWAFWLPRWISRKAVTTQQVYSDEIRCFLDFVQWMPIRALQTVHIEAYQQMLVNRGQAANTVARKVATVCSLISYIHRRDQTLLPKNIGAAVERVRPDSKLADRILTEGELVRIFDGERNPRNLALIRLLYSAGLRISEALTLRWKDVLWRDADCVVSVVGKGSKPRSVVVYGPARAALAAIAPTEPNAEAFVFTSPSGRPLHRIYCVQIIRRSAKRAGITKKVSCHWFRHSHASHALDHRAPLHLVSATLGHANLATTGRYLHCRPDESAGKYLVV